MSNNDMLKRLEVELKANRLSDQESSDSSEIQDIKKTKDAQKTLAIIGSKKLKDRDFFDTRVTEWIDRHGTPVMIVTGTSEGTDQMAVDYAEKHGIPWEAFKPDYSRYLRKYAPSVRNTRIIEASTHVMAFPSRTGIGTQDSIRKAKRFKRKTYVYWID